jgi:peroxiredoxin
LRSFQLKLPEFRARGIRVVAISVDSPEINRGHRQEMGFSYTFLSDPKTETIRRYDLLHAGAGPKRTDIARPAEFLLDPTGTVRWVNLTENIGVRARPVQVLQAFDRMQNTPAR